MSVTDALEFNKTAMFAKIRNGLSSVQQQTQELLDSKDDLLFAWDANDCCVLVSNWRAAQFKQIQHQTLLPSTPQNFDVERVIVSNEGSLLALAGTRGVAILELPRRWGKNGQYMDGKQKITCRTSSLDALLFSNNPHLQIRQVRWHPGSTTDSHLLVLLSDNTLRVYNNSQLRQVWQVGPISVEGMPSKANSSFNTFGEAAVDFDIAPAVKVKSPHDATLSTDISNLTLNQTQLDSSQMTASSTAAKVNKIEWPLLLLRENGNIYVLMIGLDTEKTRLQGPITMTPQAYDNYGLDSCAILVVPSQPPTLVIAESNGKLHHALLLEAESAENSFIEVDASINIQPSEWTVHVLETVELELGLPKLPPSGADRSSFNCPIHLKRDFINELRYFAYHNTGLHVVSINFVAELQRFLESESVDDKVSLSTPSRAEYLVCTKINSNDRVNAVLGFVLLQLPVSLVLLLSSGQVISLKIMVDPKLLTLPTTTTRPATEGDNQLEQLLTGPSFVEHIRGLLQRNLTQPILSTDKTSSPSPHECYGLLNQAVEVLRSQYLKRHDTVRSEFAKRINRIRLQKEQQLREIENLEQERELISERAHKLAERFEEINDYQELLVKRCYDMMRQVNIALPGNVAAEREFAQDVAKLNKSVKNQMALVESAKKSINKQNYHIAKANETVKSKSFELPEKQHGTITEVLTQMASEIDKQIRDIKRINNIVGV